MSLKSFLRRILSHSRFGASLYAFMFRVKRAIKSGAWSVSPGDARANGPHKFFVDLTGIAINGGKWTGVERVVRNLFLEWRKAPPEGYDVVAVAEDGARFCALEEDVIEDKVMKAEPIAFGEPIAPRYGDVFVSAFQIGMENFRTKKCFREWRQRGVRVFVTVHDLNSIRAAKYFDTDIDRYIYKKVFASVIDSCSGVVAVSRYSAEDIKKYFDETDIDAKELTIDVAHNGCKTLLLEHDRSNAERHDFLMVGQILPHKAIEQTIAAFDDLWAKSFYHRLVLLGRTAKGFSGSVELAEKIRSHPQFGRMLVWLDDASDEDLAEVYARSRALIFASYIEGFGLPLIEAAQNELPIICRDHPLYREVCGSYAFYFEDSRDSSVIADAVERWVSLDARGEAPQSKGMPYLTWEQSAARWKEVMFGRHDR